MKTIGMIGGMSWESSSVYYRLINEQVRQRLGGVHSARSLMLSVDFGVIERLQHEGRWDDLAAEMANAARQLELGGADKQRYQIFVRLEARASQRQIARKLGIHSSTVGREIRRNAAWHARIPRSESFLR